MRDGICICSLVANLRGVNGNGGGRRLAAVDATADAAALSSVAIHEVVNCASAISLKA